MRSKQILGGCRVVAVQEVQGARLARGGVRARRACALTARPDKGRPGRLRRPIREGAFMETGRKSATVDEITIA